MKLDARLQAVLDFVPEGGAVADIGTDHGYLAAALIEEGRAEHVIASDLNLGPCEAARRTVREQNLKEQIEVRQGDTDFYFMRCEDPNLCVKRAIELMTDRIPRKFGLDPLQPGILHRIDAGTSGLVLAARTADAFERVRAQLSAHEVRKVYLARVAGRVEREGGVSGHLAHSPSFRGRMRCVSGAALPRGERPMFAETFFRPIASDGASTLLEVTILTGVTHQIRCQLASIGHPILGDAVYGGPAPSGGVAGSAPRHLLHALSATFVHPLTGRETTLRVPRPDWAR